MFIVMFISLHIRLKSESEHTHCGGCEPLHRQMEPPKVCKEKCCQYIEEYTGAKWIVGQRHWYKPTFTLHYNI